MQICSNFAFLVSDWTIKFKLNDFHLQIFGKTAQRVAKASEKQVLAPSNIFSCFFDVFGACFWAGGAGWLAGWPAAPSPTQTKNMSIIASPKQTNAMYMSNVVIWALAGLGGAGRPVGLAGSQPRQPFQSGQVGHAGLGSTGQVDQACQAGQARQAG